MFEWAHSGTQVPTFQTGCHLPLGVYSSILNRLLYGLYRYPLMRCPVYHSAEWFVWFEILWAATNSQKVMGSYDNTPGMCEGYWAYFVFGSKSARFEFRSVRVELCSELPQGEGINLGDITGSCENPATLDFFKLVVAKLNFVSWPVLFAQVPSEGLRNPPVEWMSRLIN